MPDRRDRAVRAVGHRRICRWSCASDHRPAFACSLSRSVSARWNATGVAYSRGSVIRRPAQFARRHHPSGTSRPRVPPPRPSSAKNPGRRRSRETSGEVRSVVSPQTKARRVWRKPVGEGSRIVVDSADRVGDKLCDCLGVLVVREEVGRYARPARDEQAAVIARLTHVKAQHVKADVSTSRLASLGEDEVVRVGREMTKGVLPAADRCETTPSSGARSQAGTSGASWSQAARSARWFGIQRAGTPRTQPAEGSHRRWSSLSPSYKR